MEWFPGLDEDIALTLGDSIRQGALYDLGDPFTGEIEIRLEDAEMPGLVWIHAHSADNTTISGQPDLSSPEDKQTASRALLPANTIPDDLQLYGLPVLVSEVGGILTVTGLSPVEAAQYLYGLKGRPQRSIDISQLDYGLLRPTAPVSPKVLMSPFRPALDGLVYDVPALASIDLVAAYEGALSIGQAKAIKVEVDPATATLHYSGGAAFTNTTHKLAFAAYYPKTVTTGRYLLGWVKVYEGMQVVGVNDIYPAQEIYSKATVSGYAALRAAVVCIGEVVTANGEIVWIEA